MSRRRGRKRRYSRVQGRKLAAMSCAVILCAMVFAMTIAARVYLTELSDESAKLNALRQELQITQRRAEAENALQRSAQAVYESAAEKGLISPSEAEYIFIQPPEEDTTVYHSAYQTILDKPDTIWEYFG